MDRILELLKMKFSKSYRQKKMMALGRKLWLDIDDNLPETVGITSKDKIRLQRFSKLISDYSTEQKNAIAVYLEYLISDSENSSEFTATSDEEAEAVRALKQSYCAHLQIVKTSVT